MLVVCDTSPVTALLQIGRAELLLELFSTVCIPPAVRAELERFHYGLPSFLEVRQVTDQARVDSLSAILDVGEAEAIVLAIEVSADRLLIDERQGRSIALQAGVPVIGLLGVLLLAKKEGLITSVKDSIDEARTKAGFYVTEELVAKILEAAGE